MNSKTQRHSPKCRRSHPKDKKRKRQYRIRNWREYNSALVQRGSLTVWFDDAVLCSWRHHERSGHPGRPRTYSATTITCMATLQQVYHLPLRATEGLLTSVMKLLKISLSVPDHSTLSRRRQTLEVSLPDSRLSETGLIRRAPVWQAARVQREFRRLSC